MWLRRFWSRGLIMFYLNNLTCLGIKTEYCMNSCAQISTLCFHSSSRIWNGGESLLFILCFVMDWCHHCLAEWGNKLPLSQWIHQRKAYRPLHTGTNRLYSDIAVLLLLTFEEEMKSTVVEKGRSVHCRKQTCTGKNKEYLRIITIIIILIIIIIIIIIITITHKTKK